MGQNRGARPFSNCPVVGERRADRTEPSSTRGRQSRTVSPVAIFAMCAYRTLSLSDAEPLVCPRGSRPRRAPRLVDVAGAVGASGLAPSFVFAMTISSPMPRLSRRARSRSRRRRPPRTRSCRTCRWAARFDATGRTRTLRGRANSIAPRLERDLANRGCCRWCGALCGSLPVLAPGCVGVSALKCSRSSRAHARRRAGTTRGVRPLGTTSRYGEERYPGVKSVTEGACRADVLETEGQSEPTPAGDWSVLADPPRDIGRVISVRPPGGVYGSVAVAEVTATVERRSSWPARRPLSRARWGVRGVSAVCGC